MLVERAQTVRTLDVNGLPGSFAMGGSSQEGLSGLGVVRVQVERGALRLEGGGTGRPACRKAEARTRPRTGRCDSDSPHQFSCLSGR